MLLRFILGLGLASAAAFAHPALAADARTLQIVVSTDRQSLAVYDGDQVVATSKVSTGKQGHSTPLGIFSILEKERYHESNIYSNAPMPFMQRLTWSGIALHESASVPNRPASHGCVRLPKAFARMLYQMTERGVHVVIAARPLVPQPVDNAALFRPQASPAAPLFPDIALRPTRSVLGPGGAPPVEVAMNDSAALPLPAPPPQAASAEQAPLRILITRRDLRANLRDLQGLLNGLGFAAGEPDGLLGPATAKAIADFKAAHGIAASDGLVGPALMKAAYAAAGKGEPPNAEVLVRQNFKPLFEAPAIIAEPEEALGTHFFTAHAVDRETGQAEWYGLTLENDLSKETRKRLGIGSDSQSQGFDAADRALSRITIPDETRHRIEDLLAAGSSLIISDTGIGPETGDNTDFIAITHATGLQRKG